MAACGVGLRRTSNPVAPCRRDGNAPGIATSFRRTASVLVLIGCLAGASAAGAAPRAPTGKPLFSTAGVAPLGGLPAAAAMAVSAPGATVYAGNTAPAFTPIVLQVRGSRIKRIAVQYDTDCFAYASVLGTSSLRRAKIARNGRFTMSVVTSLVDSPRVWWIGERYPDRIVEKFTGTVRRDSARGTVRATLSFLDGSTCTTGEQRWLVTHRPGRVFGGETTQSMPVSVEVSATGRRVKHLHVGWIAAAPDGSAFPMPDFLTNFDLTNGAATETFRQEYPIDGGVIAFDYQLSIRVAATTSTGRLKVTVTEIDEAGAVQRTAATPTVTWRARS
jgi:hypothetical protein